MEEERGKRRSLNALIISLEFCLQNVKLNSDQSLTPYCLQKLTTPVSESYWFDCWRYHWWLLQNNFSVAWYNPYHYSAYNKVMFVHNKLSFIWTFDIFSDAQNLYCGGFNWNRTNLFLVAEQLYIWSCLSVRRLSLRLSVRLSVPNFCPKFLSQIFKRGSATPARFVLVFLDETRYLKWLNVTKLLGTMYQTVLNNVQKNKPYCCEQCLVYQDIMYWTICRTKWHIVVDNQ